MAELNIPPALLAEARAAYLSFGTFVAAAKVVAARLGRPVDPETVSKRLRERYPGLSGRGDYCRTGRRSPQAIPVPDPEWSNPHGQMLGEPPIGRSALDKRTAHGVKR